MNGQNWDMVLSVIRGAWPGSMADPVVTTEWREQFDSCDLDDLIAAIRGVAKWERFPSVSAIAEEYRATHVSPPPPVAPIGIEAPRDGTDWVSEYAKLPQAVRSMYGEKWGAAKLLAEGSVLRCLLVVQDYRRTKGAWMLEERVADPERAESEASTARAQRQIDHERRCSQCSAYSQPSATLDRQGEPCPTGKRYWASFHRLNGGRWNTPRAGRGPL